MGTLARSSASRSTPSGGGWRAKTGGGLATDNVAARFVVRQTGAARARAELFEPEELDGDDPVTEDGEAITPDDPAAGVKRATTAFRELLGRTAARPRRSRSTTRNCTAAPANASVHEVQEPCGADVPRGCGAASSPSATRKTITMRSVGGSGAPGAATRKQKRGEMSRKPMQPTKRTPPRTTNI